MDLRLESLALYKCTILIAMLLFIFYCTCIYMPRYVGEFFLLLKRE